eukprot:TRINITY_DN6017_c0_g1_i1.p1 TRINITY_DN6017_c0_g1~~TRINITY_DN6017_c0_g1_i1.p1  ORF type:complete len:594 (+),score=159.74 TRINITY_DN6017_c0_g1_i1:36-1817(+)
MIEEKKTNFLYRSKIPFHPKRLNELLNEKQFFNGVIESKGIVWISTRFLFQGIWKGNSGSFELSSNGEIWLHQLLSGQHFQVTKDMEEKMQKEKKELIEQGIYDEKTGDQRQEINFIGYEGEMDEKIISKYLDGCLLNKEELLIGSERWPIVFEDPFEQWAQNEENDHEDGHDHEHGEKECHKVQTIPSQSIYMRLIRDISQMELVEKDDKEEASFSNVEDLRVFDVKFKVGKEIFCFHFKLASIYPQIAPKVTMEEFEKHSNKFDQKLIDSKGKLLLPILTSQWKSFYDLNDVFQEIRSTFLKIENPFKIRERNKLHYGVGKSFFKGGERVMLDCNVVIDNFKDKNTSVFAVFDGYQTKIKKDDNFSSKEINDYKANQSMFQEHVNQHKNSVSYFLANSFEKTLNNIYNKDQDREETLKKLFHQLEESLLSQKDIDSVENGASCTVALLEKIENQRYVTIASYGDSLSFIIKSTKNKARLISDLHSLHNDSEHKIIFKDLNVEEEVKSELFQEFKKEEIPTRGFGFLKYKKYINKEIYVKKIQIEDDDSMLILASKGLWSNVPGIEIPMILNSQVNSQQMSDDLVRTSKHRG